MQNEEDKFLLDVPFYANTSGDGNQCYQVAMQSAIKYYLHKDMAVEELDRLTGRGNGKMTWTPQVVAPLFDLGLNVKYYSKSDTTPFLGGEKYIRERFGKDADNVLKLTDVDVLVNSIKTLEKHDLFDIKVLTLDEIKTNIRNNRLPLVLIDWNKIIDRKDKFYQGHFGVLTGFDNENLYFHQSGPADPTPNMKISNKVFMDAWNASETDNDIIIVFGKRD